MFTEVHVDAKNQEHKLWSAAHVDDSIIAGASDDIIASEMSKILEGIPGLENQPETKIDVDHYGLRGANLEYTGVKRYMRIFMENSIDKALKKNIKLKIVVRYLHRLYPARLTPSSFQLRRKFRIKTQ